MTTKFLYVTGDSFCFDRDDASQHWPARLAKLLNVELRGSGYPGQGWWSSRSEFMDYAHSDAFQNTDVFVFCHTDMHRPLTANSIWTYGFTQQMLDFYLKHISDSDVDLWTTAKWYEEITQKLQNKTVVNLHCFNSTQPLGHLLPGINIKVSLTDLSRFNHKNNIAAMNHSANHLTPRGNSVLADLVYNSVVQGSDQITFDQFQELVYMS
jgi:hypothetical protein